MQLKGGPKQAASIPWTEAVQTGKPAAKAALAGCVKLIHPLPGAEISLLVGASEDHIGPPCSRDPAQQLHWDPWDFSPES